VACFPMLAMSGVDQNEAGDGGLMRLGPNQILATRAEHGKFYYVEHTGAAIETGEKKLQHLEELMASYGAQFLKEKPGDLKATVRALDSAEALSQLQAMTLVFKDALETALMVMSDWGGIGDGGPSVEMSVDFGLNDPDEKGWAAIENARKRREISREATINEMTRRGWLSDDYDQEADKVLLEAESKELMDAMAKLDLDPTAPDDPTNPPKKAPTNEPDDTSTAPHPLRPHQRPSPAGPRGGEGRPDGVLHPRRCGGQQHPGLPGEQQRVEAAGAGSRGLR